MTIDLPGVEDPMLVDALVELTRRAAERFTGNVEFNFTDGTPQKVRVTSFRPLGVPKHAVRRVRTLA